MKPRQPINEWKNIDIPGYDYGRSARSPLSVNDMREIEQTVGWNDEDVATLQAHKDIFLSCAEQMVDSWRAVIASHPHLVKWFFNPSGERDAEYATKVKARFVQWVIDVCLRPHDRAWLDYQEEIGLRHTPQKKNQTDGRQTPPLVPLRYLLAFVPVVAIGARKFFLQAGLRGQDLDKLEQAWLKAVILHVTLWTRPYTQRWLVVAGQTRNSCIFP
jgi:hypothetical protein